jgi:intracellular sulfur oxidation DsrE/DsrF family protein
MKRRAAVLAVFAGFLLPAASAQEAKGKYRVLFQVSDNDPAKWNLALNNAKNVQADVGKNNVQIEIVAYGPGLAMLKAESPVAARLAGALDDNVGLLACENTMQNQKVSRGDMYGGIAYVQAGVTHIMKRQREGWAYIRP